VREAAAADRGGGETRRRGKLAKAGSVHLCWALVEAAVHAHRSTAPDLALYRRIRKRRDATVARLTVARKIGKRAHHALGELELAAARGVRLDALPPTPETGIRRLPRGMSRRFASPTRHPAPRAPRAEIGMGCYPSSPTARPPPASRRCGRRYLTAHCLEAVLDQVKEEQQGEEARELTPARAARRACASRRGAPRPLPGDGCGRDRAQGGRRRDRPGWGRRRLTRGEARPILGGGRPRCSGASAARISR
jgi:hypothetical protein